MMNKEEELMRKCHIDTSECGIIEEVLIKLKLKNISNLDDAKFAETKDSLKCTLILTEESAKTFVFSGLSIIGRDYYGVFPLKNKPLNVRDVNEEQLRKNTELNQLVTILGLQYENKYENDESKKTLRYGKIMIMTNQDEDGSHLKGLLINFFDFYWPNLLKDEFITQFITPVVKVFKDDQLLSFLSIPELTDWQNKTPDYKKWQHKYYEDLCAFTSKEAKEYFFNMRKHVVAFQYSGEEDRQSIDLAFSKHKVNERKEWLKKWNEGRRRCQSMFASPNFFYRNGPKRISFKQFIHNEFILYCNKNNERSIPCMVDGLRPIQRKILFASFTRNLEDEVTVVQLMGSVAKLSGHHHDETSIISAIINLAQDFVGINNIKLQLPLGQFGTRLRGGEDCASPSNLFTKLSKIAQLIFNSKDDAVLNHLYENNRQIEPEWYAPIIPMVLINGCNGIGTDWSTNIPNFNPRDVIGNIKRFIDGEPLTKMHPWYRGFRGTIQETSENSYQVYGEIGILGENLVAITELPIRNWTETYKQSVLEKLRNENPPLITEYTDYCTDETVRFLVKMSSSGSAKAKTIGYHNFFQLKSTISLDNMVLFDEFGQIRKYQNSEDILRNFVEVRLKIYKKRHHYILGKLKAETSRLVNQFRFITEKIGGVIQCENVQISALIEQLKNRNYESDPVESWRKSSAKDSGDTDDEENEPDFTYLTSLPMLDLTEEQKNGLDLKTKAKLEEFQAFQKKTPKELWLDDLEQLEMELAVLYDEDHIEKEDNTQLSVRVDPISKDMKQTAGRDIVDRINKNPKNYRATVSS